MKIEPAQNGDFVLDTAEIAEKFGFSLQAFRRCITLGYVKSSVELGTGSDEGNVRLSLSLGNRRWLVILDPTRHVIHEEMAYLGRS